MISLLRRMSLPVLALAVAGVLSACGSDSSTSALATQTPSAAAPKTVAPSAAEAQQFCDTVNQQRATLQGTELPALLANGTPDAWKAYLDKTTTMNQQLADSAPASIQPAVKALQATSLDLKAAMAAANYDVSKVGSAKLLQLVNTQQRKDATTSLVSFVKVQCGVDLTQVG